MKLEEAIPYLLELGLLSKRDLTRSAVRVEDASRRNRNLRVSCSRRAGFLLKQADPSDPSAAEGIRREAGWYALLQGGAPKSLRQLIPRFYSFDSDRSLLVLELLQGAPLGKVFDQFRTPQREHAAALGHALKHLQRFRPPIPGSPTPRVEVPWALRFAFPGTDMLRVVTVGQLDVIRAIQRDTEAWRALNLARTEYRGETLVHGDIRWDNLLIAAGTGTQLRLRLVDWELAALGDAAWDIGSVFAGFLARCIAFMEPGARIHAAALQRAFGARLPIARSEIRAFWQGLGHRSNGAAATQDFLVRATQHSGARLLQTAFEWSPGQEISPIGACFVQLGLNILKRPVEAARAVLGLS